MALRARFTQAARRAPSSVDDVGGGAERVGDGAPLVDASSAATDVAVGLGDEHVAGSGARGVERGEAAQGGAVVGATGGG